MLEDYSAAGLESVPADALAREYQRCREVLEQLERDLGNYKYAVMNLRRELACRTFLMPCPKCRAEAEASCCDMRFKDATRLVKWPHAERVAAYGVAAGVGEGLDIRP